MYAVRRHYKTFTNAALVRNKGGPGVVFRVGHGWAQLFVARHKIFLKIVKSKGTIECANMDRNIR
jgi:hypothetical protein